MKTVLVCAEEKRKFVASSMGFTVLEGLMTGTRDGSINPGIILYLQKQLRMPIEAIETLLYYHDAAHENRLADCSILMIAGYTKEIL